MKYPIFLFVSFLFSQIAFAGGECCVVTTSTVEEIPSPSHQAYTVEIPKADFDLSIAEVKKEIRGINRSARASKEGNLITSNRFFWEKSMNDTVEIYILVLPQSDGVKLHGAFKNDQGWVDPESGSQAAIFTSYMKKLGEHIYTVALKEEIKDVKGDQKDIESDLKKTNKDITKLRKKNVKHENDISKLRNKISMEEQEQKQLIQKIGEGKSRMSSLKREGDKSEYKGVRKNVRKLEKDLKKSKKNEEKMRKKILDYQAKIRGNETEISKHRGTREHLHLEIENREKERQQLKRKMQ